MRLLSIWITKETIISTVYFLMYFCFFERLASHTLLNLLPKDSSSAFQCIVFKNATSIKSQSLIVFEDSPVMSGAY